ncbi:cytochrome P450 [Sphingomonas sp. CL5.1]|uniref:cytochrome P450 n=1 Tax=Sphingomonas sp. CL5.1 TaxID=2653203 RepID=UPI001583E8E7|nr:cytochrome P450 [Sphingomonas sp. CL5.1]
MAQNASAVRARQSAATIALEDIDVSDPELWRTDSHWPYFERLRAEDPVHFCANSQFGPYWSVTKFNDIMAVDTNHDVFSSDIGLGGITILDDDPKDSLPMFIAMDPPKHDHQRKTVAPIVGPKNLANMEALIRSRAAKILDDLPIGETFDWVERVSIELTTQMLATLFDFPFEDRYKLTYWSDVATTLPAPGALVETVEEQNAALMECLEYFVRLWNERINADPGSDLVSMLAHGEATRNMTPKEYLGNIVLLIVGGNDTTRNSMTGSVLALNQNPDQYQKLRDHPELIPSMVSETIRWQTPLAHMRRTATRDTELGGKRIAKGDKVIMWYVSGNRDKTVIENPDSYIIDRERPRQHMSFGFGIHRCVGNRLAEMQLRIVWEEILKRYPVIEVVGEPERPATPFVKGYRSLPVRIPASSTLAARAGAPEERRAPERPVVYRQPVRVLASATAVSAAGALLFNLMPTLLATAASRFGLDQNQIGAVGSSYLAGFALVATTSNLWIDRFDWRKAIGGGAILSIASLAGGALAGSFHALLTALVLAGIGLGVLYTVCIAVVSENHKPDQAFGAKLAGEVALAVAGLFTLTSFVIARWGFSGGMMTLACLVGVAVASGMPGFPARRALVPPEKRFAMVRRGGGPSPLLSDWPSWLGLAGLFVSFMGLSALWAFVSEVAPTLGVGARTVDGVLTTSLIVGGVASLAAVFIGDKFGRARPLAIGMLLAISGVAALQLGHGPGAYLAGVVLAVGLWNFPMAYQMGMIASSDGRGKVAVLMPAALAVGGATGPLLAGSLLAGGTGFAPLYALFAGAAAIGLTAFMVLGRRLASGNVG